MCQSKQFLSEKWETGEIVSQNKQSHLSVRTSPSPAPAAAPDVPVWGPTTPRALDTSPRQRTWCGKTSCTVPSADHPALQRQVRRKEAYSRTKCVQRWKYLWPVCLNIFSYFWFTYWSQVILTAQIVFVLKLITVSPFFFVFTEGEGGGTPVCPPAKKEYRDDPFHQVCKHRRHMASWLFIVNHSG